MGRNSYLGGSTIIGPNSGWFTFGRKEPKRSPLQEQAMERARLDALSPAQRAKSERKAREKSAAAAEKQRKRSEQQLIAKMVKEIKARQLKEANQKLRAEKKEKNAAKLLIARERSARLKPIRDAERRKKMGAIEVLVKNSFGGTRRSRINLD